MTNLDLRWSALFADVPAESFDRAAAFWTTVLGARAGTPVGDDDEHVPLEPQDGSGYVWLQRVGRADPGWHVDLYVPELPPAVEYAASLGARVRSEGQWWVTFESPAGLPFCFVQEYRGRRLRPTAREWRGGRSELDQVCLDLPAPTFDAEADFWAELTGWPRSGGDSTDFERLDMPDTYPLRIVLQRLGADDHGGPRAHADFVADDRSAEVARHVEVGAAEIRVFDRWTVLRDICGLTYCVTDRD